MGFFSTLKEIGKNGKNLQTWEQEQKDRLAQREALHNKKQPTEEEIARAKQTGSKILEIIDVMDNHSESVAENVESAVAPVLFVLPFGTALGTGWLSGKYIINPASKKIREMAENFDRTEEAKAFYQKLEAYNKNLDYKDKVRLDSLTSRSPKSLEKILKKLNDFELKNEAVKLNKKFQDSISLQKKSRKLGGWLIPISFIASFVFGNIFAAKIQVNSSKVARFQARESLNDPKAFVTYTPEQIEQAKAELKAEPKKGRKARKEKKVKGEKKLRQGLFGSIFGILRDNRAYKRAKQADNEASKLVTRELTPQEIKQAEIDQDVIQRTVKIINNEAEKYSENMEVAAGVLIGGTPWLGAAIGGGVAWVLNKLKVFDKSTQKALNKVGSAETKELYNEFKAVKNPGWKNMKYNGKFWKFFDSFCNDIDNSFKKSGDDITKRVGLYIKGFLSHVTARNAVISITSGLVTGLAGIAIGLKLQKSAARAGRYTAKRELEKDPRNFIGYSKEDYEEVKDVKSTKKEESKFKQYALFIPRVLKQYFAYAKYRKNEFKQNQVLQKQLQKQEVTDEQLREAKNLQRKLFNTFEKVDDNSQQYSESMEAAIEIAQPFVTFGGILALLSPVIYTGIQASRGKISTAKIIEKISSILGKSSKIGKSKIFKKYLNSVEKNVSTQVQNQYVEVKPLKVLLKDIDLSKDSFYDIATNLWKNVKGSSVSLNKASEKEIERYIWDMRFNLSKLSENSLIEMAGSQRKNSINTSIKVLDQVLDEIGRMPKETQVDLLEVMFNPSAIKNLPKERYNKAISTVEKLLDSKHNALRNVVEWNIPYSSKENFTSSLKEILKDAPQYQDELKHLYTWTLPDIFKKFPELADNPKVIESINKEFGANAQNFIKYVKSSTLQEKLNKIIPVDKLDDILKDEKLLTTLEEILGKENFSVIKGYAEKLRNNPQLKLEDIASQETIGKILEAFEKQQAKTKNLKEALTSKPFVELVPDKFLDAIPAFFSSEASVEFKNAFEKFVTENRDEILKYVKKEEMRGLLEFLDMLSKDPRKALADNTTKDLALKAWEKLNPLDKNTALSPQMRRKAQSILIKTVPLEKDAQKYIKENLKIELKTNARGEVRIADD